MNYEKRLENVSVLGAAGKMGSGILLLTAIEMADLSLKPENKDRTFVLNAIDVSKEGLAGLMQYLKVQVQKIAEKKTVLLRKVYADRADLIENEQIINQYVFDVLNIVRPSTRIEAAYDSRLVFEAVIENMDLKVKLLSAIDKHGDKPWFFTNTSSIPIEKVDKAAKLKGRIIGFHFYNPPAVQRLVELIATEKTSDKMKEFAREYAKNLGKVVVPSNDKAGFIGNGHFMRDALHGIQVATNLSAEMTMPEAIYMVNKVTQDYLVRPMGIFQLIDYVGVDVVSFIMSVMNPYLPNEDLHSDFLDTLLKQGVKGGQYSSGAQKDGILKYEKGRPVAVYNTETKKYVPIEAFKEHADKQLGEIPPSAVSWKSVVRRKDKDKLFRKFFGDVCESQALGARLAKVYGKRSNEIGKQLVESGVAFNEEDVNTVMLTGFFHAYGPINDYFI